MELIWVMWFMFGLITGVVVIVSAERSDNGCADIRNNNTDSDRQLRSVVRYFPPEEVEVVLYNLRIGASRHEKEVIDYLIDREKKDEK